MKKDLLNVRIFFGITLVIIMICLLLIIQTLPGSFLNLNFYSTTSQKNIISNTETIQKVIDGDTVETNSGVKIRYLYIDTPETVKPNTKVMCYGLFAKEFNKKLVEGKKVYLMNDKSKVDRYGRELKIIFLNQQDLVEKNIEKSVNYNLVSNGYARAVSYSPNTTHKKLFESAMQIAQNKKIGLWGNCQKPFEE
jgi:micrococcal nuclease